jgi:hypothetical protein
VAGPGAGPDPAEVTVPALGKRRARHRAPLSANARPRRSALVELPEAPGAASRPAPLVIPLTAGRPAWQLALDAGTVRSLAVLLAVLDLAPPGPLLDLVGDAPEHALLAAAYSSRPVRALAPDELVAHAARQAAASNALPVVVEERTLGAPPGPTLDDYAATTALEPAVLHAGPGVDVAALLAGGPEVLAAHRPWVVVTATDGDDEPAWPVEGIVAQSYGLTTEMGVTESRRVYVLAPEAAPAALAGRAEAWADALSTALSTALERAAAVHGTVHGTGVLDLRDVGSVARSVP